MPDNDIATEVKFVFTRWFLTKRFFVFKDSWTGKSIPQINYFVKYYVRDLQRCHIQKTN